MNTNNYEYAHIGNSDIKKEMYIEILNDNAKPYGGFWACPNNKVEGSISDRTDYVLDNIDGKFLRYNEKYGCLFNIKPNSNILYLKKDIDVEEIKSKYSKGDYIDYEQISKHYDALFVNPYSLSQNLRKTEFNDWNVRSLLIFNLDCIEEYLPFEFKVIKNIGAYITSIGDPKIVNQLPSNYYHIEYLVYQLFKKRIEKKQNTGIEEIKFELMEEFRNMLNVDSYNMVESIIINEASKQKRKALI